MIGLLTIAAIPTTVAVAEAVSEQKKQNQATEAAAALSSAADGADARRLEKFQVEIYCDTGSRSAAEINGCKVVLHDGKLYVASSTAPGPIKDAHPFRGFYITYPPASPPVPDGTRGLVSTIADDPPVLNWIYVDAHTLELKYGNRTQSREHVVGPWDWTVGEDEEGNVVEGEGVTLEGIEGFVAVREDEGVWGLRFDRRDDGLKGVEGVKDRGKRVLTVSLERRIVPKPEQEGSKE